MIAPDPDLRGGGILSAGAFGLRPLEDGDADDLLRHLSDPRVVAFMDIDPLTDIEQARDIVDWAKARRALGAGLRWAIRDTLSGDFVGTCGFNQLVIERGRRGELAYDLAFAWWGRGVMNTVIPRVLAFAFGDLALHRLEAFVTPGNQRSCRLLERHGFLRDGVLRGYGEWKGRYHDQIVYSRLAVDDLV